jgi:hypothetical protein
MPHQRAIALDYGMTNGQVRVVCRQAQLFYAMRSLGLGATGIERPEAQQIILKNREAVEPYLQVTKPAERHATD